MIDDDKSKEDVSNETKNEDESVIRPEPIQEVVIQSINEEKHVEIVTDKNDEQVIEIQSKDSDEKIEDNQCIERINEMVIITFI